MKRFAMLVMSLFILLAACVQDGETLTIFTADPNVAIHFKLLPPPPLPTPDNPVLPTVVKPTATPETLVPTPTPECLIKGNVSSSGEKIAHSPGQANYDATVIDESKGEKWFCTLEEAEAEGWRPAER